VKLTANQCIQILPAELSEATRYMDAFEVACPVLFREPGRLKRALAEGWMRISTVLVDGRPAWLLGWQLTDDAGLWVHIAQTAAAGVPFSTLDGALDALADKVGARYIRFATHRRGLARRAQSLGYTPEAVILTKGIAA
jgi:hypothetical protein